MAYGTTDGTSATVVIGEQKVEPYVTMYPHMMDNLVPNSSVGIQKVRDSFGIPPGTPSGGKHHTLIKKIMKPFAFAKPL